MRANLPRSWLSLPQKEKDIISKVLQDEALQDWIYYRF